MVSHEKTAKLEADLEEAREKTTNLESELLVTHERDALREAKLVKTRERAMLREAIVEAEVKAAHERALQAEERAVIAERDLDNGLGDAFLDGYDELREKISAAFLDIDVSGFMPTKTKDKKIDFFGRFFGEKSVFGGAGKDFRVEKSSAKKIGKKSGKIADFSAKNPIFSRKNPIFPEIWGKLYFRSLRGEKLKNEAKQSCRIKKKVYF